jgi:hypothetical protein
MKGCAFDKERERSHAIQQSICTRELIKSISWKEKDSIMIARRLTVKSSMFRIGMVTIQGHTVTISLVAATVDIVRFFRMASPTYNPTGRSSFCPNPTVFSRTGLSW